MLPRLVGIALGAAVAWQTAAHLPLGRGYALAGPAFAMVLLLTALVAERLTPRAATTGPRTASLTVRRIRDYLPVYPTWVAGLGTVLLIALLTATTAVGVADDLGRAGRAISNRCGDGLQTNTPWPGSYYSIPILIATAACLALAFVALQTVTRRPRFAGDDVARRRAGEVIISGYGIAVLTPLAGVALAAVNGAMTVRCVDQDPGIGLPQTVAAVAAVGVVVFWAYLVSVLLFGRKVRA
ncbi:hypothetical protein ACFQZ4_05605 [Catellatospora coxensis]|uniref:Uncharacterized protein n=1 Tax=Catellatospora coxensis TaxID=310354 RepID=A0A8J3KUI0_9ACTN|nr:hypothetical protein [Catellatospora coxensis]GIG05429.1 hypothetical protein Cco03nite_21290 [Catellatospora coxensis]